MIKLIDKIRRAIIQFKMVSNKKRLEKSRISKKEKYISSHW